MLWHPAAHRIKLDGLLKRFTGGCGRLPVGGWAPAGPRARLGRWGPRPPATPGRMTPAAVGIRCSGCDVFAISGWESAMQCNLLSASGVILCAELLANPSHAALQS